MTCGEKFSHLVPKPVGPTDVFGWSAYAERKAAADRIHGYIEQALAAKPAAADSISGLAKYRAAYEELPNSTWWTATPDEELVAMAQANAEDGACILELVEDRTGATPVPASGTAGGGGKSIIDQALSLAFLGSALFGMYWLSQRGKTNTP